MSNYPGDEPRDPFAPKPEGAQSPNAPAEPPPAPAWGSDPDATGPVTGHDPSAAPPPHGQQPSAGDAPDASGSQEQPGYWERQAQEQAAGSGGSESSPWSQSASDPGQDPSAPPAYGQPAPSEPYQGYGQQYGGQPAYGGYGYAAVPDHPQATTSLVLGLVGLIGGILVCGLPLFVSPFAWAMGRKAVREIDASGGRIGGRSNANAGMITGIIGTVLLGLALLVLIGIIVLAVSASNGY